MHNPCNSFGLLLGIAQSIAAAPDGFDVVGAAAGVAQLLAQLAYEHVDDLEFGFVHAAIEVVEEHVFGKRGALAQRQELKQRIFLAGEVDRRTVDFDSLGLEVYRQLARVDDRLRVPFGTAHHGVDVRLYIMDALVRRSECVPYSRGSSPIAVTHSSTRRAYCLVLM